MITNSASDISVGFANGAIRQIATQLKQLHACPVHVGRFINEDTGETAPAYLICKYPRTNDA